MWRKDFSFEARGSRYCRPVIFLGIGGRGRSASRCGFRAQVALHGEECPHTAVVEYDLTEQTGSEIELPLYVSRPDRHLVHIVESVNCAAVVRRFGRDLDHPYWTMVDPAAVRQVTDTRFMGGYAAPPVGRLAMEINPLAIAELCRRIATMADRLRSEKYPGWTCREDALLVLSFASMNGCVGSTALHLLDRLRESIEGPVRLLHTALLLADRGRVASIVEARALQQAGLEQIQIRAGRLK